jgi:biopolymer transport protein ExbB
MAMRRCLVLSVGLTLPQVAAAQGLAHAPIPVVQMLASAHVVVQGVSAILALALFATTTILLYKAVALPVAARRLRHSRALITSAESLAALGPALAARRDPAARMAEAALTEMAASAGLVAAAGPAGVKERVRAALEQIAAEAAGRQRAGTGILATVASTAPFIGLFGTVWGIMSSFLAISAQKTTNLAVVAPGIAEALLVTGFGLVAAIPAVIVYNVILRRVARWRLDLAGAAVAVEAHLSRELDRRATEGRGV